MKKRFTAILITVALSCILLGCLIGYTVKTDISVYTGTSLNFETIGERTNVHSRVRMYKDDTLIFDEFNAGVVVDIGDSQILGWIFGDDDYMDNMTDYHWNATYIAIGNQGSLSTASTVLPGEWNRTIGTVEDEVTSSLNLTCTIYPDASGPYTADCISIQWAASGSLNMLCYDVFTEVTGIDETFTINIEWIFAVDHT